MKLTIDTDKHGKLVARDEAGNTVAGPRSTYCNPAALAQIILEAEMIGEINWEESKVAKPRDPESTDAGIC